MKFTEKSVYKIYCIALCRERHIGHTCVCRNLGGVALECLESLRDLVMAANYWTAVASFSSNVSC